MPTKQAKTAIYLIITVILTLGLSISLQSLLAAWTPPAAVPPAGNTGAPIYANSPISQEMANGLKMTGGLSVANGKFYVDPAGNLTKINDVAYSWPASQGAANTFLSNNGSGNLSWLAIAGLPAGTSGQTLRYDGANWVANSNLYNNGASVGIGATPAAGTILAVSGQDEKIIFNLDTDATDAANSSLDIYWGNQSGNLRHQFKGNGDVYHHRNVGIGTAPNADPNVRLDVAGQIKITGGTPGASKVLTSDADGLASWQLLSSPSEFNSISFKSEGSVPIVGQYNTTPFSYTGGAQTFTVPACVSSVEAEVAGAQGGGAYGGKGGKIKASFNVTPGETLNIYAGGAGVMGAGTAPGGYNGGGAGYRFYGYNTYSGGGASDIRRGGAALSNRVIVAGGGGGEADYSGDISGGAGGGATGADGSAVCGPNSSCGGKGGSPSSGGAGGSGCLVDGSGTAGAAGSFGTGGASGSGYAGGGGGGGGYYGGGGGGASATQCNPGRGAGGGGGSSYANGTITSNEQGVQSGNGYVILTYPKCQPGSNVWSIGLNSADNTLKIAKGTDINNNPALTIDANNKLTVNGELCMGGLCRGGWGATYVIEGFVNCVTGDTRVGFATIPSSCGNCSSCTTGSHAWSATGNFQESCTGLNLSCDEWGSCYCSCSWWACPGAVTCYARAFTLCVKN